MAGLTSSLGSYIAGMRYDKVPAEALTLVRNVFTDTVGVMMSGMSEPVVDIVRTSLMGSGSATEARACLSPIKVSAPDAALLAGTAGHALDYDDQTLSGHPGTVLVPAILAEGELLNSNGRAMVTAFVTGYEVWAELLRRDSNYHTKGWHPTSVYGTVAAAASIAVLHGLSAEKSATALAIAASHAGGLAANFGTMTKPYHAGMAARSGVVSARLARAGMTAKDDALENAQGFLHAFSPSKADRESPAKIGTESYLLRHKTCIKKYPTCYFMHRSFDTAVKMLAGRKLRPEDVAAVEVTMGKGQTAVLVNERPKTGLEAKFSEQFAMAAAVVLGRMGLTEVTDEYVQRPDIQAFFPKVKLIAVDAYDSRDPAHSPTERVVIRLANGEVLDSGPIVNIKGHADDPLTVEELWTKFIECTALTHSEQQARAWFDLLQSVENMSSPLALATCDKLFAQGGGALKRA